MTATGLATEEMQDCPSCSTPTFEVGKCFACSAKANGARPVANRIVIAVRNGAVTAVYVPGNPFAAEVLIADIDNYDRATVIGSDGYPMAALADIVPIAELPDIADVSNMVRAFDGEPVICEQCGDEFATDQMFDAAFCSKTCHDRHWRM